MKILFISMHSIHAIRWIENLKDTDHELYWFDVLNRGKIETIDTVIQYENWKLRKLPYIKGEYFMKKKISFLYEIIQPRLEVTANEKLEKIIHEIKPDVIHSFEMQSCSYSILKTMKKFSNIKWIYSCWGNDLFYYKNHKNHKVNILNVLKRINYLHTDCIRDYNIASNMGFKGAFLGVIPGGTGYKINELKKHIMPFEERKIILVKGYEHLFGRGLNVVKALEQLQFETQEFEIIVFGAHNKIFEYITINKLPFIVYNKSELKQNELLELMGKAKIYIGNSISDGMPNTLLESMTMGAFPIQSNPGNVTEEIIKNNINGLLIENPEDINEIKKIIQLAILNPEMCKNASNLNFHFSKENLDYKIIKTKVIQMYETIL